MSRAYGVSGDGTMIVGHAADPMGDTQAFVATVYEPTTVVLLIAGAASALNRRPRRIGRILGVDRRINPRL